MAVSPTVVLPAPAHPAVDGGELFQFHPRASNPELWRTTVPLVVRMRCGRHKGLIATWTAIHWLIVLYAASGRCAFGMREIAQEAGVGRNELAGPTGYIQRLVGLGLLRIVGYEPVPGVKEPRPIYHIDLAELERQSLELVPALLCERRLPPPPRPAPDPRQLALFKADEPATGATVAVPARGSDNAVHDIGTDGWLLTRGSPVFEQATHETGTGAVALAGARTHGSGAGAAAYRSRPRLHQPNGHANKRATHETGTAGTACGTLLAPDQAAVHETGTAHPPRVGLLAPGQASMHETGTGMVASQPDRARNRDVERKNEENERASEITRAHDFHQIVAATAQTVILVLQQQGIIPAAAGAPAVAPAAAPASLETIPAAPAGQPALRASVVALWQGERASLSPREHTQLALLADSYDASTGGFGAYWLGRAIILADLCLSERGRPMSLTYVRKMLRRWADEDSWGSDLPCEDAGESVKAAPQLRLPHVPKAESASATPARTPAGAVAVTSNTEHPAIAAYEAAFGRKLNQVQAEQIAATVTDLAVWQRVLTDWQANGWQPGAVAKMLDRYRKDTGTAAPAASEPAPSVRVIHTYPGLDLDQRERWIRKFHAATTPADKRAVLARLEQEHPR